MPVTTDFPTEIRLIERCVVGTRLSLDAIKRRLQNSSSSQFSSSTLSRDTASAISGHADRPPPLFIADVVLVLPKIVVQPNFDAIQATVNKAVQTVIHVAEAVPQWEHLSTQQGHQKQVRIERYCRLSRCKPRDVLGSGQFMGWVRLGPVVKLSDFWSIISLSLASDHDCHAPNKVDAVELVRWGRRDGMKTHT